MKWLGKAWEVVKYGVIAGIGLLIAIALYKNSREKRLGVYDKILDAKEKMRESLDKKTDAQIVDGLSNAEHIRNLIRGGRAVDDPPPGTFEKDDDSSLWGKGSIFR